MSEIKKYLDQEGIKILWNQVNLNDYPNNETLIAVLNAIDETKADKEYVDEIFNMLTSKQDKISGTEGQFVVIGANGNVTTKTIPYAEEASF